MDDNKSKALAAALSQIEKQFGKGSIMRMGDAEVANDIQAVSTGSLGLDIALGIGGLPRGRIIEIYGPESSGKTTVTLSVIAEMQKLGGTAAFIDAEHALDPQYAAKLQALAQKAPQTKLTMDLEKRLVLVEGGESVPFQMAEPKRQSLVTGTWDSTSLLLANAAKTAEITKRLPYVSGF